MILVVCFLSFHYVLVYLLNFHYVLVYLLNYEFVDVWFLSQLYLNLGPGFNSILVPPLAGSPGRSASSTSAAAQPSSPNPAIRDLPPPVSPISIPRAHTFSFLLSVDFSAHPTDSPPAAPPRRRLPPVAAVALRAAPPLQLPSARAPGELCPVPDHAVRAPGHRRCTGARRGEGGTGEGGRYAPPHGLGRARGGVVRTWMEREGMSG